jgi:hypothetical protein
MVDRDRDRERTAKNGSLLADLGSTISIEARQD